ncbi:hypothetical protein C8R46DRAFT_1235981 [Mycena filopes]|nr:hypothetical protein C8R46DRAFT_1235981 [Mycena filopes]
MAHVKNLRAELAALNASAAQYRILLEEVEQRTAAVQAALDAVIFPILTLPPEVTTEIFLHCAVATRASRHDLGPPPKDILNLTGICRRWRNLALSIPRLWSTLNLDNLWHVAQEDMAAPIRGSVALEHCRCASNGWATWNPKHKNLSLSVTSGRVCDLNDTLSFPLLETLNLSHFAATIFLSTTPPILAFRATPRLRHLCIYGISPPSLVGIRWELLESVRTSLAPGDERLDIISQAPSLLKFEFYGQQHSYYEAEDVILHPRLTTLNLSNEWNHGIEMMQYLTLPGLRELSLGLPNLDDGDFIQFLTRSGGELRSFEFTMNMVLSLSWFLPMMHLSNLTLPRLLGYKEDLLRALNRRHEHGFLPALEKLTLKDWMSGELDMPLVDALASRSTAQEATDQSPALTQLKSFKFIWTPIKLTMKESALVQMTPLIHENRVALQALERQGLEVYIGTEDKNYFKLF